ncbi:MAG: hypothetical protein ACK5BG_19190 [Pseudanabaena sp.]
MRLLLRCGMWGRSLFGVWEGDRFFGLLEVRSLFGCEGDRFWGVGVRLFLGCGGRSLFI